ncbi:ester cyclase [Amycolatopsis magusensis]|uniref:Ketosteroid isomerase-like protein n=1 Tax=Amycolatopsis magusensis TaxID=882444 RepID=A0ABS4PW15_9PSEU|nr:nuclear transport factor 2 family protein [Amycolatopsis magusensis]MBP2183619.1 ketosteroid isomerase-like protein [Amycolatopsis magusensis]MDI5976729.1 ester cyclase [Amycolatopsis magusensis]
MSQEDTAHPGPGEIHRRCVESYAQVLEGRLEDALKLIDPEVVDHRGGTQGDHRGREAWRQKWEQMSASSAFHDVSVTIEQNVVSGDTSVNRYTIRGTATDSGRRYEVLGLDMVRVRDGRILEHWALLDEDAMRDQLARVPARPPHRS